MRWPPRRSLPIAPDRCRSLPRPGANLTRTSRAGYPRGATKTSWLGTFYLWSRPFILWSRPLWATTGVARERQACAYGDYRGSAVHHAGRPARRARRGAGDPVADGRARPGAGEFAALRARVGPRAARRHAR